MAALLRQRRFLMLMSLAFAAYYLLKVHVKGDAEYSGFAVTVGRPDRVQYCLWAVFAWAILRYVQRLNELWNLISIEVMRDVDDQDLRLALKAATRRALRLAKCGQLAPRYPNPRVRGSAWLNPSMRQMIRETRKPGAPKKSDPDFELTERGGRKYRSFAIVVAYTDSEGNFNQAGVDFNMPEWGRTQAALHRAHAYARAAARLPAIFEHWAPLAIAGMALAVSLILVWVARCP
jgi:hypothetical protein